MVRLEMYSSPCDRVFAIKAASLASTAYTRYAPACIYNKDQRL